MTREPYAVFLSYNGDDRNAVENIAVHLADQAKLRPWFDKWSLIPGEPWVRNLERGLAASLCCAVFVGKSGEGPWQKAEVEAALRQQMQNPDFRVIPVLLSESPKQPELPTFLSGNTWVDFRNSKDNDDTLWRLECGIRGMPPGRGRPCPIEEQQSVSTISPASMVELGQVNVDIATAPRPIYVFISYHHEELESSLAHALAYTLRQAGHQVFIDSDIRWGADWVKEIREALERTNYLLVLLSQETVASEMVVEEIAIAKELARHRHGAPVILPVRICLPATEPLPYRLSAYLHNIHQESWHEPTDTPRLVKRLFAAIAERSGWSAEIQDRTPSRGLQHTTPQPYFDPRELILPGGALDVDSRFYIMREADEEVFNALHRPRAMITVRGPRQTGKTSLIMRVYAAIRHSEDRLRTAFLDFQALPHEALHSLDMIWRTIAISIAEQLQLDVWHASVWSLDGSYDRNFSRFLDCFVFSDNETPLVICLDEVDRVFSSPAKSQFFASVRAFYNRGAMDPAWRKVRWLLGTSSEPTFFLEDITQSPFNIGLRVELNTFTTDEVTEFAQRHGLIMERDLLDKIMDYVGGHPYLGRLN
jgi:hypothetical protein